MREGLRVIGIVMASHQNVFCASGNDIQEKGYSERLRMQFDFWISVLSCEFLCTFYIVDSFHDKFYYFYLIFTIGIMTGQPSGYKD